MKQCLNIVITIVLAATVGSCASNQPTNTPATTTTNIQHGPVMVDPTPPSPGMMRGKM